MSKLAKALTAAAGNAGGAGLMVEDVFSTYLYEGNGSTQTITNGIDLDGEGGLVWIKQRSAGDHVLTDTERGANYYFNTNSTAASAYNAVPLTPFNSDGFDLNVPYGNWNDSGTDYVSWTFRKKEKFFDIVSGLTSDGSGNLPEFNHSLGSTPGCVIMKATNSGSNWVVYHNGLSGGGANQYIQLNQTNAATNATGFGIATDTTFEVGAGSALVPDVTYIAYLFASDAGGFGDDGSENIIKCGSLTTDGSGLGTIDLGFEPQYMLTKRTDVTQNWNIWDTMRGWTVSGETNGLVPNASSAEVNYSGGTDYFHPTATGVDFVSNFFGANAPIIYIAIRRPMKTPESGTEVFGISEGGTTSPGFISSFPVDAAIGVSTDASNHYLSSRLTNKKYMLVTSTAAEAANSYFSYTFQNGYYDSTSGATELAYMFKRATGFFDVVAYTGTGVTDRQISHNLTVAPEIVIVKNRNTPQNWYDYHSGDPTGYTQLNTSNASQTDGKYYFGNDVEIIAPTSTVFTVGGANAGVSVNGSSETYIAYLFATLAGVSKVGSYTGTGADLNVDCGFSAGARFILIKRTDSTGDWYVWDSVRGIVVGNDPYLLLNTTAAQVTSTDYIDPLSSGFTVTSNASGTVNVSGGTYIFLAIA
jgi:hypothetical protein